MVRFIFVTGGVVSSLGKGIASASIATLREISLISGFLIGGASLKSASFIKIIKNYFR